MANRTVGGKAVDLSTGIVQGYFERERILILADVDWVCDLRAGDELFRGLVWRPYDLCLVEYLRRVSRFRVQNSAALVNTPCALLAPASASQAYPA